jgi:prepilin-type N-terminal cleavage/methylation domain-containing protein
MNLLKISVKSFTLVEMLVVLVLSSIIVGIIYFIFYNVNTYQLNLMRKQQQIGDMNTLFFTMKSDAERCEHIDALNPYEVVFRGDIHVAYVFGDKFVLRKQDSRLDSFAGTFLKPVFSWQGRNVERYPDIVDEIQCEFSHFSDSVTLDVRKYYDAAALINVSPKDSLK